MTTEFSQNSETLARARAEFESRLAEVPAWRELKELEAGGNVTSPYRAAKRQALLAELKGNPVYQSWLEACAALAKLAIGAARTIAPTLPSAVAEAVASAPKDGGGALPKPLAGPSPPDDLLQIRGITQSLAVALHRMGVRRFGDIAGWTSADVARFSAALNLGDAISRQNWIEQAAVRAPAKPAPAASVPAVAVSVPKPEAASPEVASKPEPAPATFAPAVPGAEDDLTRIRGITPAIAAGLKQLGETSFAKIANWTAADVARVSSALGVGEAIGRQSWIEQAAMRVPASALRVSSPPPAPATPAAPTAAAQPVLDATPAGPVTQKADDLTAIRVVTPSLAKRLQVIGVTSFDDIANWSSLDVERVSGILDTGDKISREAWIEQAAMRVLRRGGTLKPAAVVVRSVKPSPVAAAPQPAASVPAEIAPTAAAGPKVPSAASEATVPAAPVPPAFAAALAAIKAELTVTPLAPAPAAVAAPAAAVDPVAISAKPAPVAAPVPKGPDDLTLVSGITPLIAKQLNVIGVTRFAEIAGWTASDVARVSSTLDAGGRIGLQGWIEQAAVLARGGTTAYAARAAAGYEAATVVCPPAPMAPLPRAVEPVQPGALSAARVDAPARTVSPPPASALGTALDGLQAIADEAIARTPLPAMAAPVAAPKAEGIAPAPAHHGVAGVDTAIAELQAIADEAAARAAARVAPPAPPVQVASAEPPPLPVAAVPPPAPAPAPMIASAQQWPRMAESTPRPSPVPASVPVAVNDMPGPAEPPHVAQRPAQPESPPAQPPPLPSLRGLEGGLAAALAAAAATASATPRLTPGRLGEQIRSLPPVASDPYLEDLSDWVQDAAADLAPHAGQDQAPALPGSEAEVAIVRSETVVGDLGAVTPGSDFFDAATYAGYRREVHEASVEIVAARPGTASGASADGVSGVAREPDRGLKRLMRVFRSDPSQR